uniref:TPR_REGION domain-containing protein n=1 Tax=Glossina brevipalpis TaxID=37001 RepID=A0A1A9WPR0_9MUSC
MSKNKKELDDYRDLRGFTIAQLYYNINEFSIAKIYLNSYLSIKKDNAEAHKLLGQVYKMLKNPDKAVESFQCSLQLNTKQQDRTIMLIIGGDANVAGHKDTESEYSDEEDNNVYFTPVIPLTEKVSFLFGVDL